MRATCTAWWKSSFHCASRPNPPRVWGRTTRGSLSALSAINQAVRPVLSSVSVHRGRQLGQEWTCAAVDQLVDGVEAQTVDVEIDEPLQGVLDQVAPHRVGTGTVQVDRRTPRGPVAVRQVGREVGQHVALGTQVVVDDVEYDSEATLVAGTDEIRKPAGPPYEFCTAKGNTPS